jgi:hypothetical protein
MKNGRDGIGIKFRMKKIEDVAYRQEAEGDPSRTEEATARW